MTAHPDASFLQDLQTGLAGLQFNEEGQAKELYKQVQYKVQEGVQPKFKGIYTYTNGDGEEQKEELASLMSEASMQESVLPSLEDTDVNGDGEGQQEELGSLPSEASDKEKKLAPKPYLQR